jgi:hypothetical protein
MSSPIWDIKDALKSLKPFKIAGGDAGDWAIPAGETKTKKVTGSGLIYIILLRYEGCEEWAQPLVTIRADGKRELEFDTQILDDFLWGAERLTTYFGVPKRDGTANAYSQYYILPKPMWFDEYVEVEIKNRDSTNQLTFKLLILLMEE